MDKTAFGGAPLYDALRRLSDEEYTAFHMPGHKRGQAFSEANPLFAMDVTELSSTDNLHEPEGIILKAEEAAARAFGAEKTYFLVNGSSCGIMAMISAACAPGDKILIDRNCHRSVIHALVATGAVPSWIYPPFKEELGHTTGVLAEDVLNALAQNPDAVAVFITSPNYYGDTAELLAISKVVHNAGKLLLVDEAHGAHFAFSPLLPQTALEYGADVVVQSAHKTLPALTQSSYLHINKGVCLPRLLEALRLYQSSSPSYLLMAYLDYARFYMENKGEVRLCSLIENITELFTPRKEGDITRLVFPFENMSGFAAARLLEEEFHIVPEMADLKNVVCIATVADKYEDLKNLRSAVDTLYKREGKVQNVRISYGVKNEAEITPREAFFREGEEVSLLGAEGRIAKETVCLYPPGVPEILPGERVKKENIANITTAMLKGGKVTGLKGKDKVLVIRE